MAPHLPEGPMVGLAQSYRDAMALLTEARDYAASGASADARAMDPFERLDVSVRAMQVTACLMAVTSWLMMQRAVEAGEIHRELTHRSAYRLSRCPLCEPMSGVAVPLPRRLQHLVQRTLKLYSRLDRLDRLLANPL